MQINDFKENWTYEIEITKKYFVYKNPYIEFSYMYNLFLCCCASRHSHYQGKIWKSKGK